MAKAKSKSATKSSHKPYKKKAVKKYAFKKKAAKKKPNKRRTNEGCFLTTACVKHYNLPDNCRQLVTMRRYRDQVLAKSKAGRQLIFHYYQIAPLILKNIEHSFKSSYEFENILMQINQICSCIDARKNAQAKRKYELMVNDLLKRYCNKDVR